jgi:5-methylcytosine-specific restriction enzyme A
VNKWPSFPYKAYSWTIESDSEAIKKLDKSAFLHRGTGVPRNIRPFFLKEGMDPATNHQLTLIYSGKKFRAHIEMESKVGRTRLFWSSEFAAVLKDTFPHHHELYTKHHNPDSSLTMRFLSADGPDRYLVVLGSEVPVTTVIADIEAEEHGEIMGAMTASHTEGRTREVYSRRYERNPKNRKEAIRIHGLSCNVCEFNFEKNYGQRGADYIEVHHVQPIHTFEEEQIVNPRTDLITVCSNCHCMIHRSRTSTLTIAEMRAILRTCRVKS